MLNNIFVLVLISFSSILSAQDKKGLPPSSSRIMIKSEISQWDIINLQDYIESIYINSSKFYNRGGLAVVEKGDFTVILIDNEGKHQPKKSSDFKNIDLDLIQELKFEKSPQTNALFGSNGALFGMVFVKLKQ